jgi:CO/xanthine dehydrogenase Mo-binding subunit
MTAFSAIGQRTPLVEGKAKVTGKVRYLSDLQLPDMLVARLVTSLHAHARIVGIDATAALALPGVVAVLTARDLPHFEPINRQRLLLARERVIFAGQPVALVLAESEAGAADAIGHVRVDYEPLPAAVSLDAALAEDAPLVWPEGMPGESGEAAAHGADVGGEEQHAKKLSNVAGRTHFERGSIADGFAEADQIIERFITTAMVHQNPLETHAVAVQIDPLTEEVTVWSSTQAPFHVRKQVADILELSESQVRCISTTLGGAFGGKFVLYEPLVALAASVAGRPVRLVLNRYEELIATNPAPPGRIRVKLGARRDGTFTALEGEVAFDGGCYPGSPVGIAMVVMGSMYKIPHVTLDGLEVLSFKPSSGAYRAPGIPQALFALEGVVDDMARALELDQLSLRLHNAAKPGDPMINGGDWPLMGMTEVLEALQAHPAWQNRAAARAAGRGIGVAVGGWPGGIEPAAAACMLNRDGVLQVHLGSVDMSGTNTTFALLAAEVFGVAPDKVKIITGDTGSSIYNGAAGGSKMIYTVGPALIQAAREARRQTLEIAAELMEAAPADLEIVNGKVQVRGVPDRGIDLGMIAGKTMQFGGQFAPIFGNGRHVVTTRSPGFCAQLAEVELDPETGAVQVHTLVVVQDVGRALNPLAVEGQMMGGATQGIGWALYEHMDYDDYGQPITGSWMDYTLPQIHQAARSIETVIVEVPSEHGPFGAKGVGEPPITPTAAAIANAIADLAGVRLTDLPMTPPRVLQALSGGKNGEQEGPPPS